MYPAVDSDENFVIFEERLLRSPNSFQGRNTEMFYLQWQIFILQCVCGFGDLRVKKPEGSVHRFAYRMRSGRKKEGEDKKMFNRNVLLKIT